MKVGVDVDEIIRFQVNRNIINLYKSYLIMLEDLEREHEEHFQKLKQKLPEHMDILDQADYLNPNKMEYMRKRILDSGNHCGREIIATLEQCNKI
tara:strand:+ start:261 stop:545 length:285 start_codon:yes stop_codon:yes gene_type:complete